MSIIDKHIVDQLMARVPRLGQGWRVLPLENLPQGSVVRFKSLDSLTLPDDPPDLLRLPAGEYGIVVGIWPTITLSGDDTTIEWLKSRFGQLGPGTIFEANLDQPDDQHRASGGIHTKTWILRTGRLTHCWMPGTRYRLSSQNEVQRKRRGNYRQRHPLPLRERKFI